MAPGTRTAAKKADEKDGTVDLTCEDKKPQETADKKSMEGSFIYIGPTTRTGLAENTVFAGTRQGIEEYLKGTLSKIPQVRMLIVTTESLAVNKAKAGKAGTLLNKYYNDVLGLSDGHRED